jgi:hypothetical protein
MTLIVWLSFILACFFVSQAMRISKVYNYALRKGYGKKAEVLKTAICHYYAIAGIFAIITILFKQIG